MTTSRIPTATYRVQFNREFRFEDARKIVPYLRALGITDLYASPILKASPGSAHGYDVADPTRLNPEPGTAQDFESLTRELKRNRMGLIVDIVPNHMAASTENPWLMDVFENGLSSQFADFFDIDWHPRAEKSALDGKVLLPILGDLYGSVLENQELKLTIDEGGLFVSYYERKLPLNVKSYAKLLTHRIDELKAEIGETHPALRKLSRLIAAINRLSGAGEAARSQSEQQRQSRQSIKKKLLQLYKAHPEIKSFLDENARIFNGTKGEQASFDLLDDLLSDQAYRLAFWRAASEAINYRRFFDVSDLISVRVEAPQVFEATHALIFDLAREGKITGLRIDHIDGLFDPAGYLRRLRERVASNTDQSEAGFYVVVEKILAADESLPSDWQAAGTTGYDYLNCLNDVFVDPAGLKSLDKFYGQFTGLHAPFADVAYEQKKRVMMELFAGELQTMKRGLADLSKSDRKARDISRAVLSQSLVEVMACFPIYRTYTQSFEVSASDRRYIEQTIEEARRRNPGLSAAAFDFIGRVLALDFPHYLSDEERHSWLRFVTRWQQYTGPITAKGVEDTAFYIYNRLISLNEVGGDPDAASDPVESFHQRNARMKRQGPFTMNATSTHDTKRSEDIRARINALSEIPSEWAGRARRWNRLNESKKRIIDGRAAPDANEELFLYQTLIGAWPLETGASDEFKDRLRKTIEKSAREAKTHTSWLDSNASYEDALLDFATTILEESTANSFLKDFLRFEKRIAFHGALNSLSQTLLKIASPGVPDFYQGTEAWSFRMVDPDNRRPVDYEAQIKMLEQIKQQGASDLPRFIEEMLARWQDGQVKLFLTSRALNFRRENADLFLRGEYIALAASGAKKNHVVAFARRRKLRWSVVIVPRLPASLVGENEFPLKQKVWGSSKLLLPAQSPARWRNVLTGETIEAAGASEKKLRLAAAFRHFPVALLEAMQD